MPTLTSQPHCGALAGRLPMTRDSASSLNLFANNRKAFPNWPHNACLLCPSPANRSGRWKHVDCSVSIVSDAEWNIIFQPGQKPVHWPISPPPCKWLSGANPCQRKRSLNLPPRSLILRAFKFTVCCNPAPRRKGKFRLRSACRRWPSGVICENSWHGDLFILATHSALTGAVITRTELAAPWANWPRHADCWALMTLFHTLQSVK
jgi:hypothetical protein